MGLLAPSIVSPLVVIVFVAVVAVVTLRKRRGHGSRTYVGPGAAGAFYDMLDADKRRAIEVIAEDRAAETDPERAADGVDD